MARRRNLEKAVGYLRTSSATNVGADKDSEKRQRAAIERFAKSARFEVVDWFNDPAVSGDGRFSITNGWPRRSDNHWPISRALVSSGPPAAKPTSKCTGRVG